jgi:hypothetical protein
MVTRMDREIGRLMDLVKELSLERDTLWVFSSDKLIGICFLTRRVNGRDL